MDLEKRIRKDSFREWGSYSSNDGGGGDGDGRVGGGDDSGDHGAMANHLCRGALDSSRS